MFPLNVGNLIVDKECYVVTHMVAELKNVTCRNSDNKSHFQAIF